MENQMNSTKTRSALLTLAVLNLLPAVAFAHGPNLAGWYAGGSLGATNAEIDKDRIEDYLQGGGFSLTGFDRDEVALGGKVFGGYRFGRHFALEAGYFNLGELGYQAQTSPPGSLSAAIDTQGLNIDPVLILPLGERLSLLGRAGLQYAESETDYQASGTVTALNDSEESGFGYKVGLGLQYDLAGPVSLRAEAERYRIDDAVGNDGDIDLYSLGMIYRFGHTHAAAPMAAATPEPAPAAAPAPAPAPTLIVVPVAAKMHEYCSILDMEFEINMDQVQREEAERLAVVGRFLTKYPDTTAMIEGHSDDVGSSEHNLALSKRRAESVVDHLVGTYAIDRSRLKAVGYGATRPVADNATEEGKRQNRRIGAVIACAEDIEGLVVKPARMTVALEMEFDRNATKVRPQYRDALRKVADFLVANPRVTATVEGHTANLNGTAAQGMELSQRRAAAVVDYLATEFRVDRSRLSSEGFGRTRRYAYNTSVEGQQENRRVNIILNYPR